MKEHVSYEYAMMMLVDKYWGGEERVPGNVWNNMCNIVAFNTAQNLAWYLNDRGVSFPKEISSILGKVRDQINTLAALRTDVQSDKLQPEDFKYLMKWINTKKDELGIGEIGITTDSDSVIRGSNP